MATVFLSHASADDSLAKAFEAWLRGSGFDDLFVDHSSVRGGDKWADALRRAKASCRVVLCLVTPNWLASDECFGEFTAAWYQGKRIVPLMVGAPADDRQRKRLARVLSEDQGFDLAPALAGGAFALDSHPQIAEPLKAGLRAGGALMKVGLDPQAFEIDAARRPEPFPGLESFGDDDADAAIFYGRSPEIAELMETLRAMRATGELKPLVVLGASGSGKSSLMKAGLLPRLRRERAWLVLRSFRPGGDALLNFADAIARTGADLGVAVAPGAVRDSLLAARAGGDIDRLRAALDDIVKPLREKADRPGATVLIPLDQGEELSRAQGESADALGDVLRAAMTPTPAAPDGEAVTAPYAVAVTVRTDTFAELQLSPRFAGLDARCADIRPLPVYRFDNAVEGPAGRYGVEIDPGVVEALMEDAPGADALPLLAFAMQRLWRQYQAQRRIRLENYQSVGKLSGLLEDAAERALRGYAPTEDRPLEARLPADRERLAQRTFVPALAQVSDQGAPIRRVADFGAFDEREKELLDQFDRWRLVVKRGGNQVEVAHEALFREWPRFRNWLEPEKARLDMLRSVEGASSAWARHGRKDSYLDHRGGRLRDAKALLGVNDYASRIGTEQRDYLAAAGKAEWRRLGVMGGAGFVALVALATAGAITDRTISRGKFETHASILNGRRDEGGGARLALAALGGATDWSRPSGGKKEADRLLAERALHESGYVLRRVAELGRTKRNVNLSNRGKSVSYTDDDGRRTLWNAVNGRRIWDDLDDPKSRTNNIPGYRLADDDLDLLVYWKNRKEAVLARASDGKVIAPLGEAAGVGFFGRAPYFTLSRQIGDADPETTPASALKYSVSLKRLSDRRDVPRFANMQYIFASENALSRQGSRVIVRRAAGQGSQLVEWPSGTVLKTFPAEGYDYFCAGETLICTEKNYPVPEGPASRYVNPGYDLTLRDPQSGEVLKTFVKLYQHGFSPSYGRIYVENTLGTGGGAARSIYDVRTGALIRTMEPGRNFSYVDDEQKLLVNILRPPLRSEVQSTAERDDYDGVALMDLISGREIERYRNIRDRRASQDGSRFILTDGKNEAAIYDAQTGKVIKQLGNTASVTQRGKPGLPISGEGPTADYGGGLDRFFHRTEDGVTTMRRWSDGEVIADLGKLGSSSSAVTFPYGGKTFTTIGDDGVYTIRDMSNGAPLATFGRVNVFDYREDRIIITRDRTRRTLLAVEPVAHLRGMALRERVCSPDINRDWVGPFTEAERDPKKAQDAESKDIARRLRGRPWHVCDWRGLRSLEGWGQMFRYWGVRFGLAKDWAPDERPGQPRPRAQKKAADAPKKKD